MLLNLEREYLTLAECAKRLDVTAQAVRMRIYHRGIPVEHVGRTVLVPISALTKLESERRLRYERF